MAKSVFDMPRQQLERLSKGADVRSIRFPVNAAIDAVNEMMPRPSPASQVPPVTTAAGLIIVQMKITRVPTLVHEGDFIFCKPYLDGGVIDPQADEIPVARNYLCRRAPFAKWIGGTPSTRLGVSYTYTSATRRVATIDEIPITEVIVPHYYGVAGVTNIDSQISADIVRCQYYPDAVRDDNGAKMRHGSGSARQDVLWLDLNDDGRQWAKEAS